MSPVHIKTRLTGNGKKRYLVYFRRGGRYTKEEYAGSFRTQKAAHERRILVETWLAAGKEPRVELAQLKATQASGTWTDDAHRYLASRVDIQESTLKLYERQVKTLAGMKFAKRPSLALTWQEMQEVVAELSETMKPGSVVGYFKLARLVLDFAGAEPNPARDRRVRMPQTIRDEIEPPDADQIVAILERATRWQVLPLVVLEQTGMRVSELELTWGDVDVATSRFRLRARETKSQRAKWVPVPEWLMMEIADTCPIEDRSPERRVFPKAADHAVRSAMTRACREAGIVVYSPHDLRHRRITLWHQNGVPTREIMDRVGHRLSSTTIDIYSHVMPLHEVPSDELQRLIRGHGAAPVRHGALK